MWPDHADLAASPTPEIEERVNGCRDADGAARVRIGRFVVTGLAKNSLPTCDDCRARPMSAHRRAQLTPQPARLAQSYAVASMFLVTPGAPATHDTLA